jgi:cytochrome c peroxidase
MSQRSTSWLALLSGLAAAHGCAGPPDLGSPPDPSASAAEVLADVPPTFAAPASRVGSAVMRSPAGDRLYVAHEDLGVLRSIDLPLTDASVTREVALPGPPAALVAVDDRVFVTVRSPGMLLAFRDERGDLREIGRAPIADDAWGLALSSDDEMAIVTSAWTHTVTGVDLSSMMPRWSLDVGREPRGIAIKPGDKSVYITHIVSGGLTRIDGIDGASPTSAVVPFAAAPLRTPKARADLAKLAYAPVLSPDGERLFVPRQALGADGITPWNGKATVDVMLLADESQQAVPSKDMNIRWTGDFQRVFGADSGMFNMREMWLTAPSPSQERSAFAAARAAIYRSATDTLLIADEGNDMLVELDAQSVDPSLKPLGSYDVGTYDPNTMQSACGAPSGVTLSVDESTAYVFCRSTHGIAAVSLLRFDGTDPPPPPAPVGTGERPSHFVLAKDPLPEKAALGRRLFFNAADPTMSDNYSCNSCHPEGRDDGHVWHQDEWLESDGKGKPETIRDRRLHSFAITTTEDAGIGVPRQTPMLAGRVSAMGPYGWKGHSPSLKHRAIIGFSLHRWSGGWSTDAPKNIERSDALVAFLRSGLVAPTRNAAPLDAVQKRGKQVFDDPAVGCATCHDPKTEYTTRALSELPPLPLDRKRFEAEKSEKHELKIPSLAFIGGTAPYYHDGSIPTLELLVELNGNRMGNTKHLSKDDRAALVAFLRTL